MSLSPLWVSLWTLSYAAFLRRVQTCTHSFSGGVGPRKGKEGCTRSAIHHLADHRYWIRSSPVACLSCCSWANCVISPDNFPNEIYVTDDPSPWYHLPPSLHIRDFRIHEGICCWLWHDISLQGTQTPKSDRCVISSWCVLLSIFILEDWYYYSPEGGGGDAKLNMPRTCPQNQSST